MDVSLVTTFFSEEARHNQRARQTNQPSSVSDYFYFENYKRKLRVFYSCLDNGGGESGLVERRKKKVRLKFFSGVERPRLRC